MQILCRSKVIWFLKGIKISTVFYFDRLLFVQLKKGRLFGRPFNTDMPKNEGVLLLIPLSRRYVRLGKMCFPPKIVSNSDSESNSLKSMFFSTFLGLWNWKVYPLTTFSLKFHMFFKHFYTKNKLKITVDSKPVFLLRRASSRRIYPSVRSSVSHTYFLICKE